MADVYEVQVSAKVTGDKASLSNFQKEVERSVSRIKAQVQPVIEAGRTIAGGVSSFASGITKGTFGTGSGGTGISGLVGAMVGKLTIMIGALRLISDSIMKVVDFLAEASPNLKAVTTLFKRAFMLFFKPFGDALAVIFRPMAIAMLQLAIGFNQWFARIPSSGTTIPTLGATTLPMTTPTGMSEGFTFNKEQWDVFVAKLQEVWSYLNTILDNAGKTLTEINSKVNAWIINSIQIPFQNFMNNVSLYFGNLPLYLRAVMNDIWKTITKWGTDFTSWWSSGWASVKNSLSGIWGSIVGAVQNALSVLGSLGRSVFGRFQSGGEVYDTGLALVHRGEKILTPADRSRGGEGETYTNNITVNASVSSDYDVRKIAEELNRYMQVEHRRRISYGVY